ncbi:MAG: putative TonB-dependent receptor [Rhodospirillales bacterium]|nr:putative TonB-dependent receptor [Rhodospirillales bacterium]
MTVSLALLRSGPSRRALMGAAFTLTTMGSAIAQDQPTAAPLASPVMEEIVVTGSHIARTSLEVDVPVVSITGDAIQKTGISNLGDALNELPQFGAPGLNNTSTNFANDGAGTSTINLRNLGEARTLTLIDGKRSVSGVPIGQGGPSYAVDLSSIPAFLVDHIDIVTGGGSAVYGSEAVAGVVNIVLRDHYEGIMAQEQYGLTTDYGDSNTETFDLLTGTSFADGAGHIVFGLEYADQGAVYSKDRPNTAFDTSSGGVYTPSSFALNGNFRTKSGLTITLPNGSVVPYSAATYGFNREASRTIQIPTDHLDLYEKFSYDITPDITFYADARYARTNAQQFLEPIAISNSTTIGFDGATLALPLTNAFIPAALAAKGITSDGAGNFADWRRRFAELGPRGGDTSRNSFSVVTGLKGDLFDRFRWEAYYSYGETNSFFSGTGGNVLKLQQELDSIVVGGVPVCRDPAARAAGCVPINIFGAGSISQAAVNYFKAIKSYNDQVTQHLFNAEINGPVFALPYGDVRVATGFQYRKEDGYNRPDALASAGLGLDTQSPPTGGGYDIREYYIQSQVPVLKDLPGAKSVSIEGSFRYSDYSNVNVGGKQSYAYGITYAPIEDVLFRANNSVAIRAPNLSDLYQGRSQSANSVVDPCSDIGLATAANLAVRRANCRTFGVTPGFTENIADQQTEISYQEGNTALQAERAEVLTYGVTFNPRWVSGLNVTVDFFKYKIANAIQSIDLQTAANQCADTLSSNFCNLVRRFAPNDPLHAGLIQGVDQKVVNVGSIHEHGIDVGVNYGFQINDVTTAVFDSSWGSDARIDMRWNYEYVQQLEYTALSGQTTNQRGLFGVPKNRWNLTTTYSDGMFDINWQLRYLGSQHYADGGLLGPSFGPMVYNDLRVDYHLNDWITPYVGVNNLLNSGAPFVTQEFQQGGAGVVQAVTGTNTVPQVYDAIGRFVYFGVKFQMPWEEAPVETATYTPPAAIAPAAPAVAKSYLVFFDFNKSDLTPQAVTVVDQAAKNAGPAKVTKIEVTGHTDTVGSDAYNMRLSRRRAESVAAQLEKDGIPSSEIAIFAKGKHDLLVPTADGVKEPQNRRVQIVYSDGMTS